MPYLHMLASRLFSLVFVLLGVTVVTFVISHLIPADVARMIAGDFASPEAVAALRHELGLDRPVLEQYWIYLGNLLGGDLGTSIRTGQPVLEDLLQYFPATVELAVAAMVIAILVGVPLGVLSAVYQGRWVDHLARLFAVTGISTPSFWLGLMLLFFLYGQLGLFPAGGRISPEYFGFERRSGFYLLDALLAGRPDVLRDVLWHLALPAVSLAFLTLGGFTRLIRSSMLEVLSEDYIRTVRAAGLPEWRVIIGHALPNALVPFVTALGLSLANLLTGAVVTEAIFMWPGMGNYILEATAALDFPAIMGFTVLVSVVYVCANLAVDLVYLRLDPRQARGES